MSEPQAMVAATRAGHPDVTMRTTAALFLNRLADPTTLRHAEDLLLG